MPKKSKVASEPQTENSQSESEGDDQEIYTGNEEIQVDFEGRNPSDSDHAGIKQLLLQLFLKFHINVTELADIIIGQNYVGSVIKQCYDQGMETDDSDDEEADFNVFGITSVVNISNKPDKQSISQLRSFLIEQADKHASDATVKLLREILGNENKPVGFLINERFLNIPAKISAPMLQSLEKELKRAVDKSMPYRFDYLIMIVKLYRGEVKANHSSEDILSNLEEEEFCKSALASFEFSVKDESDTGLDGHWRENDEELTPYRKVLILDFKQFPNIVNSIVTLVNQ